MALFLSRRLPAAGRALSELLQDSCHVSSNPSHTLILSRMSSRAMSTRPPAPRLRFPPGFDAPKPRGDQNQLRPHAITLFPGDFRDDDDMDMHSTEWDRRKPMKKDRGLDDEDTDKILEELKFLEQQDAAKRQRWLENNVPPVRVPEIDERGRAYGRGGRKTASARVWIQPGFGQVSINRRPLEDYFPRLSDREMVLDPFVVTETCGKFDVTITVQGGGLTGQAGAARHGLANALNHYNPDKYRLPLKKMGYLTRDARMVERKVVGRVKARKSPQWVRR